MRKVLIAVLAASGIASVSPVLGAQPNAPEVWVCSTENFPQKFVIEGDKMTKVHSVAADLRPELPEVTVDEYGFPIVRPGTAAPAAQFDDIFQVLQNNAYGVIAVRSAAREILEKDNTILGKLPPPPSPNLTGRTGPAAAPNDFATTLYGKDAGQQHRVEVFADVVMLARTGAEIGFFHEWWAALPGHGAKDHVSDGSCIKA